MTWLQNHWLDLVGWGGSALLVYSLLQTRLLRLRVLNLIACVILAGFNAALSVWPMVGMNVVLVAINAWFIIAMLRQRHDEAAFEVLSVSPTDEYLRHVLRVHEADIRRFNPHFTYDPFIDGQDAFLVQKADETVGVVLLHTDADTAHVLLDYVTQRYRDLSPGEFVWRRSGLLADRGVRRVVTPPEMVSPYYERLGFRREADSWVLDLPG